VSCLALYTGSGMMDNAVAAEVLTFGTWLSNVGSVSRVICGLLAIFLIRGIDGRQEQRNWELERIPQDEA
jgi:hypothetical protein